MKLPLAWGRDDLQADWAPEVAKELAPVADDVGLAELGFDGQPWLAVAGNEEVDLLLLLVAQYEKFGEGGWITLVATTLTIAACYLIKRHYRMVGAKIAKLNDELTPTLDGIPASAARHASEMDPAKSTAAVLVGGYGGLGLHTVLHIDRTFPEHFQQVIFISVGVIDSGTFKGVGEIDALKSSIETDLTRYVQFARAKLGWAADYDMVIGTEAVSELERLCREVHLRFPRSVFFAGQLIFHEPSWSDRLLHNMTAYAVQRRLQFDGLPMVVLPVRVLK